MCNAKMVGLAALVGVGVATGGFGLLGAEAAAGAGAVEGGVAASSVAAGTTAAATTGAATAGGLSTLQTAGLAASIAGTGMQAYGQYQQAQAAKDAATYNQKVANIQANDAIDRGDLEQQQLGRKISALRGQQTANMAANGLDLSSGTPAAELAQTDYYGLEDQRTVANNANREAAGYRTRATMAGMQADSYNPGLTAGASLLSGGGQVADRWYKYKG